MFSEIVGSAIGGGLFPTSFQYDPPGFCPCQLCCQQKAGLLTEQERRFAQQNAWQDLQQLQKLQSAYKPPDYDINELIYATRLEF